MLKRFILRNSDRYLSRWIVLAFDLVVILFAYQTAVLLRYNLELVEIPQGLIVAKLPVVFATYGLGFLVARSYIGVIRHTSLTDAYSVFRASLIGIILLFAGSFATFRWPQLETSLFIPNSILVIHFLLSIVLLIGSRLIVKVLYHRFNTSKDKKTRVLIYGAGASGMITKSTLLHDTGRDYEIVGFIDDNPSKVGKKIEGIPIYSRQKALNAYFLERHRVNQVIISIQKRLGNKKRGEIVEECLRFNLQVKVVPPVEKWIQGELSTKQIKNLRIEDLLEREPIKLDSSNIRREIKGKVVLVSGAAGSIGSEIARQLLHYSPRKVILLDQAESAIYTLDYELKSSFPDIHHLSECVIGDVRDRKRVEHIFRSFSPDIVFHAAAYKHVPLMEDNPYEAVGVNVIGTRNMADMAVAFGSEKFVMVSTDKAVNPTNVMGATKRCAEIYTQTLGRSPQCNTHFITTRFGNVLGSNGSVIPIFRKQIQNGGPITVTHRDITRYFMTIPEACNLVLEAGSMGKGGEIFVFDMGESVKIYDLAKKMIKLSGLTLGRDIEIVEIGLRPGEKLYEELLANKENTINTYHPKIMIAQTESYKMAEVEVALQNLHLAHQQCHNLNMVRSLKNLVPEFISNNSIYGELDLKQVENE